MGRYGKFVFILIIAIIAGALVFGIFNALKSVDLKSLYLSPIFSFSTSSPYFISAGTSSPVIHAPPPPPPRSPSSPTTVSQPSQPKITPPAGFTLSQLSPYYQQVSIGEIRRPYSPNDAASFTLTGTYSLTGTVNVTGWYIKVNRGGTRTIPRAVAVYSPYGTSPETDIILSRGDRVVVYSTRSPLNRNVRLNKCIGYLNSVYTFVPPFPNTCPAIPRSDIVTFSGRCQSFILSLYGCRVPTSNEINSFTEPEDRACRLYLDEINYGGCYRAHAADADFLSNEWRVWANTDLPFDPEHDRVLLFDREGLLVNEYTY